MLLAQYTALMNITTGHSFDIQSYDIWVVFDERMIIHTSVKTIYQMDQRLTWLVLVRGWWWHVHCCVHRTDISMRLTNGWDDERERVLVRNRMVEWGDWVVSPCKWQLIIEIGRDMLLFVSLWWQWSAVQWRVAAQCRCHDDRINVMNGWMVSANHNKMVGLVIPFEPYN